MQAAEPEDTSQYGRALRYHLAHAQPRLSLKIPIIAPAHGPPSCVQRLSSLSAERWMECLRAAQHGSEMTVRAAADALVTSLQEYAAQHGATSHSAPVRQTTDARTIRDSPSSAAWWGFVNAAVRAHIDIDGSAFYTSQHTALQALKAVVPDNCLTYILMVKEPIDRIRSEMRHILRRSLLHSRRATVAGRPPLSASADGLSVPSYAKDRLSGPATELKRQLHDELFRVRACIAEQQQHYQGQRGNRLDEGDGGMRLPVADDLLSATLQQGGVMCADDWRVPGTVSGPKTRSQSGDFHAAVRVERLQRCIEGNSSLKLGYGMVYRSLYELPLLTLLQSRSLRQLVNAPTSQASSDCGVLVVHAASLQQDGPSVVQQVLHALQLDGADVNVAQQLTTTLPAISMGDGWAPTADDALVDSVIDTVLGSALLGSPAQSVEAVALGSLARAEDIAASAEGKPRERLEAGSKTAPDAGNSAHDCLTVASCIRAVRKALHDHLLLHPPVAN